MFVVSVTLLILLAMGKYTHLESTSLDYDSAWEELFGHLAGSSSSSSKVPNVVKHDKVHVSPLLEKPSLSTFSEPSLIMQPPVPPAPPFLFSTVNGKFPSIGANSYGNMEGIAISQNRGISLGIYMVNSSYNSFSTVFGNANATKTQLRLPTPA